MTSKTFLGNEAIALGLLEQGCRVATAYPGTPSSEILAGVIKYNRQHDCQAYVEWSVNEKVAFEIALAASWTGLRSAVAMKQGFRSNVSRSASIVDSHKGAPQSHPITRKCCLQSSKL